MHGQISDQMTVGQRSGFLGVLTEYYEEPGSRVALGALGAGRSEVLQAATAAELDQAETTLLSAVAAVRRAKERLAAADRAAITQRAAVHAAGLLGAAAEQHIQGAAGAHGPPQPTAWVPTARVHGGGMLDAGADQHNLGTTEAGGPLQVAARMHGAGMLETAADQHNLGTTEAGGPLQVAPRAHGAGVLGTAAWQDNPATTEDGPLQPAARVHGAGVLDAAAEQRNPVTARAGGPPVLALLEGEVLVDDGVAMPWAASGGDALAHQGLRLHLGAAAAAAAGAVQLGSLTGHAPGMPPVNGGRGVGQWGEVLTDGEGGGRVAGGRMQPSRGEEVGLEDHGNEDTGGDELGGPEWVSSESRWPRNGKKRCQAESEALVRASKVRIVDQDDEAYGVELMDNWIQQQTQVPGRDKVRAVWQQVVRSVRRASRGLQGRVGADAPGGTAEGGMDSDVGDGHGFASTGGGGAWRGRGRGRGRGHSTGRQPEPGPGLGRAPVGSGAGGMHGTSALGSAQGMVFWELGLGWMQGLLDKQPVPADQVRAAMASLASAYAIEGVRGQPSVDEKWKEINERVGLLLGYVEQLNVHNPYATVEEALLFSARLRVESSQLASPAAVRAFVRDMMEVVELGPLALRPVGFEPASGGLSTEARKRLTIAVELVSNPSVVFMDEPTSGLDARAAGMVMRAVRNTLATGRTVVCTIHQPNREVMDGFKLLLLKPGGRTIFYGKLGARQGALVAYLSSCVPGVPRYEPHLNPANWMLEVTSPAAEKEMGVDFAEVWAASEPAREAQQLIDEHTAAAALALDLGNAKGRKRGGRRTNRSNGNGNGANGSAANSRNASNTDLVGMVEAAAAAEAEAGPAAADVEAGAAGGLQRTDTQQEEEEERPQKRQRQQEEEEEARAALSRFAQPTWVQLRLLLQRALVSQMRNQNYNFARIVISICVALALGSMFWDKGRQSDTPLGVMNIMGIMYCSSIFISVVNKLMVMPVVAADRAVFYRERSSGMYRGALMAVVQGASELPFVFVQSVIYFAIVYCMVQFEWDGPKMCWYWLFVWLQLNTFTFLGIACLNLTPDVPIASAASSFCMIMWNLLCGFMVYRKDIPGWWVGGYYVNPIQWTIQGLLSSQLGDRDDQLIAVGDTTMTVAQYVRKQFSYRYEWRGWVVLVMLALIVFFRTAGNIGLLFINFERR